MLYLSVCSGIEAATVAWHPLGWQPVAFSEIEAFPSAVLAHHYQSIPNLGDMTRFHEWPDASVDVLVGGTPCQSFSVAGLRGGLADPRGNLALTFLAIAERYRAEWVVWENVPGVLSSDGGRAFGAFLGGLAELGYGFAWTVLDAQYFGLAQRRKRVFVVANLGDWRRAAAVLFESASLRGDPAPRREAREGIANSPTERPDRGGGNSEGQRLVPALTGSGRGVERTGESRGQDPVIVHSLRAEGHDASEDGTGRGVPLIPDVSPALKSRDYKGPSSDGDGDGAPLIPVCFSAKDSGADAGELAPALRAGGHAKSHANAGVMPAIAFDTTQVTSAVNYSNPKPGDQCHPLAAGAHAPAVAFQSKQSATAQGPSFDEVSPCLDVAKSGGVAVFASAMVRRLTPVECARLQGFPDDYLDITYRGKPAADGPKYKALGNSMAVPVMRWIGTRIAWVDANVLPHRQESA